MCRVIALEVKNMLEKFKNLTVKTKLNIGFSLLIFYMVLMSIVSVAFMYNLHSANVKMSADMTDPYHNLHEMTESLYQQSISAYNLVMNSKDPALADQAVSDIMAEEVIFDQAFEKYKKNISGDTAKVDIENIESIYYDDFSDLKKKLINEYESNDTANMSQTLDEINACDDEIDVQLEKNWADIIKNSEKKEAETEKQFNIMLVVIAALILLAIIASWIIIKRITRSVRGPITRMSRVAGQVAETGNFNFSNKIIDEMKLDASYSDEVGNTTKAFSKMLDDLIDKKVVLEKVAKGDLTVRTNIVSSEDTLGNSINTMIESLREIIDQIEKSSSQINKGAEQLSNGAQLLAQGSSEQASNVETLENFVKDISEKAEASHEISVKTYSLASRIKDEAADGRIIMNDLATAVEEVQLSSKSINEVTKSIESIAFQTNILSLNAAIEAARAGVHGKGFSVVSEEVKNLAGKSSEAAGEASAYVEDSMSKSDFETKMAKEATESFSSIADGIEETSDMARKLGDFVKEQNDALDRIIDTISQLSAIIHQNSSAAEETAASTEEMNSLTEALRSLVSGFILEKEEQDTEEVTQNDDI